MKLSFMQTQFSCKSLALATQLYCGFRAKSNIDYLIPIKPILAIHFEVRLFSAQIEYEQVQTALRLDL